MDDSVTVAAAFLVVGPLIAALSASAPALFPYWSASRGEGFAIIRAHPRAWTMLNAGFALATITTAAGMAVLALALDGDAVRTAMLVAMAVAYVIAGGLWCAVVAIRARTTPLLASLAAARNDTEPTPTEPAEALLGAATSGMFAAFTVVTGTSLVVWALTLALTGAIAAPVGIAAAVVAGIAVGSQLITGDSIPAILYLPTLIVGVALLAGWT